MIIHKLAGRKVVIITEESKQPEFLDPSMYIIRVQRPLCYPCNMELQGEFLKFLLGCVENALKEGAQLERVLNF